MPIGQMPYLPGQNVPGQNVPNAPGQNVPNAPGQNVPNAPGQNAQPGAAPQGALPAQNAAGAVPAAGQSPGGAGPASTPGQTMPATGGTIPATSAALSVARAPAPWTLGFTPAPAGVVSASLTARLENAKQIQKRSRISVTMQRDTAVLGGRVATEHDRDLAAAMLMLEPGVAQVQNELVVESPPPAVQGVSAR
jgi:hypothetical protein